MSKRVRTSRIANSKKVRRSRPSGEREVVGRESLSSLDFGDRSGDSEAPPSVETESGRPSAPDTDRPADVQPSATPGPVAASLAGPSAEAEQILPAVVTGETPPPPAVSAEEVVPGDVTPPPPPVEAKLESQIQGEPIATQSGKPSGEPVSVAKDDAKAEPVAQADAPATSSGTAGNLKKKKKKGASVGGTRPEDVNASSGGFSLNEPLARGFYESAPPPMHDDDDEVEVAQPVALSPEILERKARLRRIVMGVFAAASLVVILVAGKTLTTKNSPTPTDVASAKDTTTAAPQDASKPAEPAKVEAPAPAPAPAPAAEASAKPEEKKDEAKAEEKKEEPKAEDKPKGDPAELKKTASKLYNSGKLKDAIPALREAIAADPDDALLYLFLGDALTNTGKWPEAKEAFNDCVTNAKKGPKHECAAMGGTKKK